MSDVFTCTGCGRTYKADFRFPFLCKCGVRDFGPGSSLPPQKFIKSSAPTRIITELPPLPIGGLGYADGCGSELHRLLQEKGFEITPDCPCHSVMGAMNRGGPEWCRKHLDHFIVPAMVKEAKRRKLKIPLTKRDAPELAMRLLARRWAKQAIRRWEKKAIISQASEPS